MSVLDHFRRTDEPHAIPGDDVWDALRNERRRRIIQYAAQMDSGEAVSLGVLADDLSAAEYGPEYTSGERKAVYVALYQRHLDNLDQVDVVDYDPDRGVVRRGSRAGELAGALRAVAEAIHG
ncbi:MULTISPECIES: DUF7344 domain-containing protein [Halorussus]|uniref:DUF7344 domain-containing protein n=1 Tax=Halorussus TaxID=1070314 RepID=UPI0020A154DC|nr:hypothetical protein [Halorussus vallis]USZ75685.1 hypothetical protein NGM07_19930 [Halorussus vallis]USZ75760.1 hypothetical protein NGM07_00165 [Halorussus vallis]